MTLSKTMTLSVISKIARLVPLILSALGIGIQALEDPEHIWLVDSLGILTLIDTSTKMMGSVRSEANVEHDNVCNRRTFLTADMKCHTSSEWLCMPHFVCR